MQIVVLVECHSCASDLNSECHVLHLGRWLLSEQFVESRAMVDADAAAAVEVDMMMA